MPDAVEVDVGAGPGVEGARRATGGRDPATTLPARAPDPEVPATVQRRRFSAAYRLRILKAVDACKKPGEVGALLRREGLYSSLLTNWRRQREAGALREMRGRRRGPTPRPVDPRVISSRRRTAGCSGSCSARRRSSRSKKKLPRSWGSPDTARRRRDRLMQAITTIATPGETAALCHSVGVSRATLYRHRRPAPPPPRPRAPSPRALGPTERQAVLDVLHSPRFVDQSPTEVHATLLEEQTYLCSPRTMYRVLAAAHEVREPSRSIPQRRCEGG